MKNYFGLKPLLTLDSRKFRKLHKPKKNSILIFKGINHILEELHTLLDERYEAEISNTSGNLTT
ncbi:hypothetical protein BpHYR1_035588 [Brachionus plicatilis]|uniref:Uncharacterized protein n=1 Tax=Brachionus plicatilis TaxID=10195 RepID=A0A3M7R9P9_BRAPC|nr:hypothetical protein BpHYR1_035588 [Brachionus plicatilis]